LSCLAIQMISLKCYADCNGHTGGGYASAGLTTLGD
jgi:hypothetical protein